MPMKARGLLTRILAGKVAPVSVIKDKVPIVRTKVPSNSPPVMKAKNKPIAEHANKRKATAPAGDITTERVARVSTGEGPQHVFKTTDSSGQAKYHKYSGKEDLSKYTGDLSKNTKYKEALKGNMTDMSVKEQGLLQKGVKDANRAEQGVISNVAYNMGITGGVLGAAARNPLATAAGVGTLYAAGQAGKDAYKDQRTTNTNSPSTWGIGQNTSVRGGLRKMSHIDKFVEKKAASDVATFMVTDAITDVMGGKGNSRGLSSGLGYTLSRNVLPLSTRIQMPDTMAESFVTSLSSDAGKATFEALNKAMQGVFGRMKERNVDVPKRRAILQMLRSSDPVLKGVSETNLKSWYNTLASYAPNISMDKNMVSSFLKQVAQYDGQIDYGRLKELMDLEESYQKVHLKNK